MTPTEAQIVVGLVSGLGGALLGSGITSLVQWKLSHKMVGAQQQMRAYSNLYNRLWRVRDRLEKLPQKWGAVTKDLEDLLYGEENAFLLNGEIRKRISDLAEEQIRPWYDGCEKDGDQTQKAPAHLIERCDELLAQIAAITEDKFKLDVSA